MAALASALVLGDGRQALSDGRPLPEEYVAAWRHLHELFAERGAANVRWVWCPNASAFADHSAQRFYPGDAYVDWVCADGYDYPWNTASFAELFKAFHNWGPAPASR